MKTKHFILTLCLFFASIGTGFAQNKVFDKYADMDNVTSVFISKAMFRMMSNINNVGVNLMNLKGKMESLQLVTSENKDRITQMKREFPQILSSHHQELMRVKDGKTRVSFYSDLKDDKIKELIMLVDDEKNYTAIMITGNFTLQDIQDFAEQN